MKVTIVTAIRFLALTVLHFICFVVVSGALLSTQTARPEPAQAGATLLLLIIVSLITTSIWTYIILRSRLTGWKLVRRVPVMGDRRDHFEAETDLLEMVTRIAQGRKEREIDPAEVWAAAWPGTSSIAAATNNDRVKTLMVSS